MMADILRSACTDTRVSQLSALLNLHSNLLPSQEETPTSLLKGVEDSLNGLSKVLSHKIPSIQQMFSRHHRDSLEPPLVVPHECITID